MTKTLNINSFSNTDLNMYHCGEEDCNPGHYYGPALRDHYLIHYIINGKGHFTVNEKTYYLSEGDGFLICPEIVTFYQASNNEPWKYCWVGFNGSKAKNYLEDANLTISNPIFTYSKDEKLSNILRKMLSINKITKSNELKLLALLYDFISILIEEANIKELTNKNERKLRYIREAITFIEKNYSRKITIQELAKNIGLDRSYLYSVFQTILKKSPQEYLINYRIDKACELMKNNDLNISDISRSVGYNDPLYFSKLFKKIKGLTPTAFRKNNS